MSKSFHKQEHTIVHLVDVEEIHQIKVFASYPNHLHHQLAQYCDTDSNTDEPSYICKVNFHQTKVANMSRTSLYAHLAISKQDHHKWLDTSDAGSTLSLM